MSVTAQTPYKSYTAAPGATLFTTDFRLLLASDLVVKVNGAIVTTGFTVSGIDAASSDVTFGTPMVGGEIIELQRSVPKTRATDYQQLGDYQASSVNADFDRIVMMLQDAQFDNNLAVSLPVNDAAAPMTLPSVAERASRFLAFDADGNATVAAAVGVSSVNVSAFMSTVLDDLTAAAARATLGAGVTVNLNDYGAVGDGVTDNRLAILAAIAAASAAKTYVYVPNGNYAYTGKITNAGALNFLGFVGESEENTIFTGTAAGGFEFTDLPRNYRFENFTHNGPGQLVGTALYSLGILRGAGSFTVGALKNLTCTGWPNYGFFAETTITSQWDKLTAENIGVDGIYLNKSPAGTNGGTSVTLSNCYTRNCLGKGYRLYKVHYASLLNCASDFDNDSYWLESCQGTSLIACGNESNTYISGALPGRGVVITGGRGCVVTGGQTYGMPNTASLAVHILDSWNSLVMGRVVLANGVNMTRDILMEADTVSTTVMNCNRTGNIPRQEAIVVDLGGTNNVTFSGARINGPDVRVQNYSTGNTEFSVSALVTGTAKLNLNSATSTSTFTQSAFGSAIHRVLSSAGAATGNIESSAGNADLNLISANADARAIFTSNTPTTGRSFSITSNGAGSFLNFYDITNAAPIFTAFSLSAASHAGKVRFNRGIQVSSGTHITAGSATLVGGVATINTSAVTENSRIIVSYNTPGGTQGFLRAAASDIISGTSFVIRSSSNADTSSVNWWMVETI